MMFLRVTQFVAGLVGFTLIFSIGFFWAGLIVLTFSGSQGGALFAAIAGGIFLCWFATGLVRNVWELFDHDRTT